MIAIVYGIKIDKYKFITGLKNFLKTESENLDELLIMYKHETFAEDEELFIEIYNLDNYLIIGNTNKTTTEKIMEITKINSEDENISDIKQMLIDIGEEEEGKAMKTEIKYYFINTEVDSYIPVF